MTTDVESVQAFYSALFRWEPVDIPIDDTNV